jgi:phosphatidylserine/phosphatidylglycerophosphate/cardiolipin synthase-like enzyme
VLRQWEADGQAHWKVPLLHQVIAGTEFSGKRSTPYRPDAVHDYMHAKITVADDVAFVGSFNLSRSGEMNAEGVLELRGARIADELAGYIDSIRARFPDAEAP